MSTPTTAYAIVLAVFGASSESARKAYAAIESEYRTAFPHAELRWAYLSKRIVARQRKLGVYLATIEEALEQLRQDGFTQVVVQPILTVPGEEFLLLTQTATNGLHLQWAQPLLAAEEDFKAILRVLDASISNQDPHILVCHGNDKYPELNAQLLTLKQLAEARFHQLRVASIEGQPGDAAICALESLALRPERIRFIPFMITAGEHVQEDVMGDSAESWRSRVAAHSTECLPPLGLNPAVTAIFIKHTLDALNALAEEPKQ